MIHLLPIYKQLIKREEPKTRKIKVWNNETTETLKGCFDCTNWGVFFNQENDIDVIVESISDYINFCENNVIIEKTIKVFPNSKPWVGKELKVF